MLLPSHTDLSNILYYLRNLIATVEFEVNLKIFFNHQMETSGFNKSNV